MPRIQSPSVVSAASSTMAMICPTTHARSVSPRSYRMRAQAAARRGYQRHDAVDVNRGIPGQVERHDEDAHAFDDSSTPP